MFVQFCAEVMRSDAISAVDTSCQACRVNIGRRGSRLQW